MLLVLSMLGGLWLPMEMMPPVMQTLAQTLPSYWLAELGRWPMLPDTAFPWAGVLVLLAWVRRTYRARSPGLSTRHGQQQAVRSRRGGREGPMPAGETGMTERRSVFRPGTRAPATTPPAAPARHYGPDAAAPFTLRRAVQNKVWIYGFGLIFLLFAIAAIPEDDPSPAELTWRVLLVVALAVGYLGTAWMADCSLRTRWLYIGGYVGLLLVEPPDVGVVVRRLRRTWRS